jgi:hypothetical protein
VRRLTATVAKSNGYGFPTEFEFGLGFTLDAFEKRCDES